MKGVVAFPKRYNVVTSAKVYSLKAGLLVVGKCKYLKQYYIVKMKKAPDSDLPKSLKTYVSEDEQIYSKTGVQEYLKMANADPQGFKKICGIMGFIKFLAGYYVIFIEEKQKVCTICRNSIFSATKTAIYPLFVPNKKDTMYIEMLNLILQSSKDFYFSYTYDITSSLQDNVSRSLQLKNEYAFNDEFVWNTFLLTEFSNIVKRKDWLLHLSYGFVGSVSVRSFAFPFSISLIARRSRFYAGTRYLKRGVNEAGKTGNFVEIEQIVEDERIQAPGKISISSYVHVRGSIPVLWKQGSAAKPKPEIILNNGDYMLTLTKTHIADLIQRYGTPVTFMNLTKLNSKREERLSVFFRKSIKHVINLMAVEQEGAKLIQYKHADLSSIIRSTRKNKPDQNVYLGDARISTNYLG